MFTISYRDEVREKIIAKAKADSRIVSVAVVGSYAKGTVDRWSDIDLTFGIHENFSITKLLEDWTEYVNKTFAGIVLLDVHRDKTIYRVFVLPGCLQLDLSFSTAKEFGAVGKHFNLLYGKQYDKPIPQIQPTSEIFGWIIHHILRARFCVERNRLWQAEFWISEARNYALKLACISKGLTSDYGRGLDDLSNDLLVLFKDTFVKKIDKEEIIRVIKKVIEILPEISDEVNQMNKKWNSVLNEIYNL